jgi:hypothetical protein
MDVQAIASPGDWITARNALMQDLARLRNHFASGMSIGSNGFAPLFGFAANSEDGWNGCLNRLEAFLVFAQAPQLEPERRM